MICIVPLAGPDLVHPQYGLRPLHVVDGQPILQLALRGRAWGRQLGNEDYVFVLRACAEAEQLNSFLASTWPGSKIVVLSEVTGGALYSALAGAAYGKANAPILIDLADIVFEGEGCFSRDAWPDRLGGIVPCFPSSEPIYSYIRSENGVVVEAAEKRVISDWASAGVYGFRNAAVMLAAAAHSIQHADTLSHRGALFVCPMMNGVLAQGLAVAAPSAGEVRPVGKMFH